jgi:hypothetical protein
VGGFVGDDVTMIEACNARVTCAGGLRSADCRTAAALVVANPSPPHAGTPPEGRFQGVCGVGVHPFASHHIIFYSPPPHVPRVGSLNSSSGRHVVEPDTWVCVEWC